MSRLRASANLAMLFTDAPLLERFGRAAAAGFGFVEFAWPVGESSEEIVAAVRAAGVEVVLVNFYAGDMSAGERGVAALPGRFGEFRANVPVAIELADALGVRKLNAMLGHGVEGSSREAQLELGAESLDFAAAAAAKIGAEVLVEPLNPIENPGILLRRPDEALALIDRVGRSNLSLQLDLFHAQRTEGNLVGTVADLLPRIGHIQVADSPGRGEPGSGEIAYDFVLAEIAALGYDGWIGLEYVPTTPRTEDSFGWLRSAPLDLGRR